MRLTDLRRSCNLRLIILIVINNILKTSIKMRWRLTNLRRCCNLRLIILIVMNNRFIASIEMRWRLIKVIIIGYCSIHIVNIIVIFLWISFRISKFLTSWIRLSSIIKLMRSIRWKWKVFQFFDLSFWYKFFCPIVCSFNKFIRLNFLTKKWHRLLLCWSYIFLNLR